MNMRFDIQHREKIESGEYSVICDGKPIEIVKWDCEGPCPILGVKTGDDGRSDAMFFKEEGCTLNEKFWLYIVAPDNFTAFEQAVADLVSDIDGEYAVFMHDYAPFVRKHAPLIMAAAEREMREMTNGNYAWLVGKEQAYKNMPQWRRAPQGDMMNTGTDLRLINDHWFLHKDGWVISIDELFDKMRKEGVSDETK